MTTFEELFNSTKTMNTRDIVTKMQSIESSSQFSVSHDTLKLFCMYYVICCNRLGINPKPRLNQLRFIDADVIKEGISEGWIDESEAL